MAQQEADKKIDDSLDADKVRVEKMLAAAAEDAHLAAEHKLIKVQAYVRDEEKAEKKTKNNERQERFVEAKKEEGLKKDYCPVIFSDEVKTSFGGNWDLWLSSKIKPPEVKMVEKIVEKIVEKNVPAVLSVDQQSILNKVAKLRGWRKRVFNLL